MTTAEQTAVCQNYLQQSDLKKNFNQFSSYPFVRHLSFAERKDLILPEKKNELEELMKYLCSNRNKYTQFLRQKNRYPSYDVYACFQPFNEAFKALYPFVTIIKKNLNKGDVILNLWDRSGWTAGMLGGWFPEQQIVTVWEGDKDILGYKGFDYWMSEERRKNHSVVFADFTRPLPFEDNSASAVIGLDLLHRFNQPELLNEIDRVAKAEAPIIFPHVHLTNSMPEPFFERGCRQLHGNDYQYLFDTLENLTQRKAYILSEPGTFKWNDSEGRERILLKSSPSNPDYNACIAWLPVRDETYELEKWKGHEQNDWEEMYLLQNPFLVIDALDHTIQVKEDGWGENIFELFSRHPVYAKKINESINAFIPEDVRCVLYLAMHCLKLKEILQVTGISKERMQQILAELWQLDLANCVPVDEAGFGLQTLLGQQVYIPSSDENDLAAFWKQKVEWYGEEVLCMQEEDTLTYSQADELIQLVQKALLAEGLKKGNSIIVCGELHTELLLMFWAAVTIGITVVPLSAKEATSRIADYAALTKASFIITEPALYDNVKNSVDAKVIMTDDGTHPSFNPEYSFENWLEQSAEKETADQMNAPHSNDIAVILFTTGSTGNPKGVPVTHQQLIRSGRLMTETYHWKKTDKYYALGGLETMSGLRHATVSIAEAGASCIIPYKTEGMAEHFHLISSHKATILTANPAFFKHLMLLAKAERKTTFSVRLALCTGNRLTNDLRESWKEAFNIPLYNYYGLTETGGICIAELLDEISTNDDSIGKPIDCLVKIIDEEGKEVKQGEPGELCIYSTGIFKSYFNNKEASEKVLEKGWFKTGDVAVMHKDGSISLKGRLSNIVKLVSGERVEINAVEEVMNEINGLIDFAVCPLKKAERESIAVFIVLDDATELEEVVQFIKTKIIENIGAYATPTFIEVVNVIPRGNHNKVLQKELFDLYLTVKNS